MRGHARQRNQVRRLIIYLAIALGSVQNQLRQVDSASDREWGACKRP
jgi:hypothetical protein